MVAVKQKRGENTAAVRYGLSYALSHLNYEFAKTKSRMVPFKPNEANKMEVVGLRVGERVPVQQSRQILVTVFVYKVLLAPTGALIVIVVYYTSKAGHFLRI